MDRMTSLQPIFVDITWGAGGSTKDLTFAIAKYTQTYFGVECLMHLTCTNMKIDELKLILNACREAGIQNILVLRGDPVKGATAWEPIAGGLNHAIDLVKLIKKEHGDYFGIAVAGFPEGHPQNQSQSKSLTRQNTVGNNNSINSNETKTTTNSSTQNNSSSSVVVEEEDKEILYLKQKVDAGADFILTNFFYDSDLFISYIEKCRKYGITCPIIPGMYVIVSISYQYISTYHPP